MNLCRAKLKRMLPKKLWKKEMKNRDIYNNKLDKLKKTYENEMRNERPFLEN